MCINKYNYALNLIYILGAFARVNIIMNFSLKDEALLLSIPLKKVKLKGSMYMYIYIYTYE